MLFSHKIAHLLPGLFNRRYLMANDYANDRLSMYSVLMLCVRIYNYSHIACVYVCSNKHLYVSIYVCKEVCFDGSID